MRIQEVQLDSIFKTTLDIHFRRIFNQLAQGWKAGALFISLFIVLGSNSGQAQSTILTNDDSIEIKYIASQIKDPDIYTGIFNIPDPDNTMPEMRTGAKVEFEGGYIDLRKKGMTPLKTIYPLEREFDSMIFISTGPAPMSEGEQVAFFWLPGTTWLLLLKKALVFPNGRKETRDWLKQTPESIDRKFITSATSYYLASQFAGCYVTEWKNPNERPVSSLLINADFAKEVVDVTYFIHSLPLKLTMEQRNERLKAASGMMKTFMGKQLLSELLSN